MASDAKLDQACDTLSDAVRELSLGTSGEVQRIRGPLDPLRFLRDFVTPGRPCVVTDALTHWPALTRWTDRYLRSVLQHQPVSVHFTPDGRADAIAQSSDVSVFVTAHVERRLFPEAMDLILASERDRGQWVAYAQEQNGCFLTEYGLLAGDAEVHIPWASEALGCTPEAVNLWIGSPASVTSFHKDHYENLYAVVAGEKHFTLLPPTDVHRLYIRNYPAARYVRLKDSSSYFTIVDNDPHAFVPWVSVDPYPKDTSKAELMYPKYFNGPAPFTCTVRAGEILYLPSMWFHHVRQSADHEGRAIALNFWYDMQYDIKYAYFNMLQSLVI